MLHLKVSLRGRALQRRCAKMFGGIEKHAQAQPNPAMQKKRRWRLIFGVSNDVSKIWMEYKKELIREGMNLLWHVRKFNIQLLTDLSLAKISFNYLRLSEFQLKLHAIMTIRNTAVSKKGQTATPCSHAPQWKMTENVALRNREHRLGFFTHA